MVKNKEGQLVQGKFFDVKVEGVQKILGKLNRSNPVIAKPWTAALTEAGRLVEADMRKRAPGRLGSQVTLKMQARIVPLWAHVGLMPMPTAPYRGHKPFRFPGALHGSEFLYHYRSGPYTGQKTHNWLTLPLQLLQTRVNALLGKAADRIKTEWDS